MNAFSMALLASPLLCFRSPRPILTGKPMSKSIGSSNTLSKTSEPVLATKEKPTPRKSEPPKMRSKPLNEGAVRSGKQRHREDLKLDRELESDEENGAEMAPDEARRLNNPKDEIHHKQENTQSSTHSTKKEKPLGTSRVDTLADGRHQLNEAIKAGAVSTVKRLIKQNPDIVSEAERSGSAPLLQAIAAGHDTIAKELITANTHLDEKFPLTGENALMLAIDRGSTDLAKILIEKGANIHLTDSSGSTALMYATRKNHAEIASMLIKNNARIDLKGDYGDTELGRIITSGHTAFPNLEQKSGSDVDSRIDCYRSAFLKALSCNRNDIANFFIDKIGQFNLQDPLDHHWLQLSVRNGNSEGVRIILENSLKIPNTLPVSGKPVEEYMAPLYANMAMQNLLFEALSAKNDEIASLLMEHAARSDILLFDQVTKKACQLLRNSKIGKETDTTSNLLRRKMFETGSLIPSTFQSGMVDTLSKHASAYTAASLDPAELTDAQLEMIFFQSIASSNELHSESEKISEQRSIQYAHIPLRPAWIAKLLIRTAQFKADQHDRILAQFINNLNPSVTTQQLRDTARNAGWHPIVIKFLTDIWTSLARRRSTENFFAAIKTRLSTGEWSRKIMGLDSDEARHLVTLQLDTLHRWIKEPAS